MAAIDLLHLIDRLEEQIGQARRLPIGTGSVVDRRRLLDIVDQLRAAVPADMREAHTVLEQKGEVLAQADSEVALRLARADEEVERRISESEVTKAAEVRGQQLVAEAQAESARLLEEGHRVASAKAAEGERLAGEQMDEADRYALEMLRKLEQQLDAFKASVRAGIETLEKRPDEPPPHMAHEPLVPPAREEASVSARAPSPRAEDGPPLV